MGSSYTLPYQLTVSQWGNCYEYYLLLKSKPRILPMPTKIIKDKSKYTRKDKHKRGK